MAPGKPVLFICGPYHEGDEVARAVAAGAAADASLRYMGRGWNTMIPPTVYPIAGWKSAAIEMALQCDAAFFLKGWRACPGAVEIAKALEGAGIPYWDRPELVPPAEGFEDWVKRPK